MVVRDIRFQPAGPAAVVRDDGQVRPAFQHGPLHQVKPPLVFRPEVFIPDLQVIQPERRCVPHFRAERAPFRIGRPQRVLQRVQDVADHVRLFFLVEIPRSAALAGHAAVAHVQRRHAEILAQLQVFVESQPVGGAVMPQQPVGRTLPYRADRIAEIPYGFHRKAFHDASAGEAQEGGVDVPELFRQVLPESVPQKGLRRHQRNKSEPYRCPGRAPDSELRAAGGHPRGKHRVIPGPAARPDRDDGSGGNLLPFLNAQRQFRFLLASGEHIETVFLPRFLGNSAVSDIPDTAARGEISPEGNFPLWIQRFRGIQGHLRPVGIPCRNRRRKDAVVFHPLVHSLAVVEFINPSGGGFERPAAVLRNASVGQQGIFKGTVPDHFGIEPAVSGMADILKKEAVKIRRDRKTLFQGANIHSAHLFLLRSILI